MGGDFNFLGTKSCFPTSDKNPGTTSLSRGPEHILSADDAKSAKNTKDLGLGNLSGQVGLV